MLKLCGLWKNKKHDGELFLAGNLGGTRVVVMANKFKSEDTHPDWIIFLDERKSKTEDGGKVDNSLLEGEPDNV